MSPLFDAALGKSESATNSAKYVISTEKNQNDWFEKSHLEAAARSRFSHSSISGEAKAEGGRVKIQSNSRWWGRGDLDEIYNDGDAGDDNGGGGDDRDDREIGSSQTCARGEDGDYQEDQDGEDKSDNSE